MSTVITTTNGVKIQVKLPPARQSIFTRIVRFETTDNDGNTKIIEAELSKTEIDVLAIMLAP